MGLFIFQDKARKATGMQIDATGDDYGDPDLFSISVIKVSYLFLGSCFVLCLLSGMSPDFVLIAHWKSFSFT